MMHPSHAPVGAPAVAMVAGEASGDLLAGLLLGGVRQRWPDAIARGIGGPHMAKQGFEAWWPHHKLAVHGFSWELLKRYREIVGIRRQLGDRLLTDKPDVFIGVDAPDFNLDLEARLKAQGVKTVHFVCPSIWAWRPERVEKLRRSTDHVLCIFPFEPELLAAHGIGATYVGHPLASVIPMEPDKAAARHTLDLIGCGHHAGQGVVFGQPLDGRLGTHFFHPGHVVHGVADQGQVIDDAIGWHTKLGQHTGLIQGLVAHGVDQRDAGCDQLRHVLVTRGDDHLMPAALGHRCQRADGVIGLDARHLQDGPAQQADHLVDGLDLCDQVLGHRGAVGLVLGIPLVAEGGALGVEHTHGMFGRHLLTQAPEHVDHAVHGARGFALRTAQVRHGVEGSVEVAGAVYQQHGRFVHGGVLHAVDYRHPWGLKKQIAD